MNETETLCHMAWDYLMFFPFDPAVGYCCRSPRIGVTPEIRDEFKQDLFSNYPRFVERRADLLKGKKHSDCDTCWKLEEKGFKSSRHDADMFYFMEKNNGILHKTIDELRQHPGQERSKYADCIEIVLNNVCDAKCTYCSEMFSTQWFIEKKKFGDNTMRTPMDNRDPKLEQYFWDWYKNTGMKHMWRFGFIGGEPLIVDALYEYLDKLIEIHDANPQPKKKEVCFTSNMNTPPVYFKKFVEYIPKLEKHFKIIVQASGESVGEELEYIRSGVIYSRWKENIEYFLKNTSVDIHFLPTLNLLSIPGLMRYLEYWEELCERFRPIPIHDNIVSNPRQQSPMFAPKEFAQFFDEPLALVERMLTEDNVAPSVRWSWNTFHMFLKSTRESVLKNKSTLEMMEEPLYFYRYFKKLDERRNTSVTSVFPDFTIMYKLGEKIHAMTMK
ncbi:MAG: twitch domain-containing radical SAM protein [Bacteriovoracaceae bacterium]